MIEALLYYCAGYEFWALFEKVQQIMHLILLSLYTCWGIILFPWFFFYDGLVFKENYHDLSNILSILASLDDYQMYGVLLVPLVMMYSVVVSKGRRFLFVFSLNIPIQGNTIVPVKIFTSVNTGSSHTI